MGGSLEHKLSCEWGHEGAVLCCMRGGSRRAACMRHGALCCRSALSELLGTRRR